MPWRICWMLMLGMLHVSCGEDNNAGDATTGTESEGSDDAGTGPDGDADTDMDKDVDTETDSDRNTATESSGDSETNREGDTASDVDGDTDTDADIDGDTDADVDGDTDTDVDSDNDTDTDTDTDTDSEADTDSDSHATCPAAALGDLLDRGHLMLGGAMTEESLGEAPFDLRYQYLSADVPETGPCEDCREDCSVNGITCADNSCEWWGCWQWVENPPGQFVRDFIAETTANGTVPMFSYYIWYSVAGNVEGDEEVFQLADGALLRSYLLDFRFLMTVIGETPEIPTIVHVEPDLWGYGNHVSSDPTEIPAAVGDADITECNGLDDNMAGLVSCFMALADTHAPNVLIGFHASDWGAGIDAGSNTDPGFDVAAYSRESAAFMNRLGADRADLLVVEMSDRDAGYNGSWWDPTNETLPNFTQAMIWAQGVSEEMGLAPLWWQVPYGNMSLDDTTDRYRDVRVDYFFDHPEAFADMGALGIAFGAGMRGMTTAETDGGNFLTRSADYYNQPRPPLCGRP